VPLVFEEDSVPVGRSVELAGLEGGLYSRFRLAGPDGEEV
jgi:hypothetical protein